MSLTDDLYREIILEHFRNPRNQGRLENPDMIAEGANPFCGDELELTVKLHNERIQDIRAQGKGCSISQASTSMMTEAIQGKTLQEAEGLAKQFKAMMLGEREMDLPPDLEDMESLEGVRKYPVRIKCAILSWNTLLEGIQAHWKGGRQSMHMEGEEGERPDLTQQLSGTHPVPVPGTEKETSSADAMAPGGDPRQEEVRAALRTVIDPELNINVVDLGLIYGIDIQADHVKVTYTLTSPGCPLGPVIKGQMQSALGRVSWIKQIQPELVWSPPWDPRTMASEEAKTELGIW